MTRTIGIPPKSTPNFENGTRKQEKTNQNLETRKYLEGHGHLVNGSRMEIVGVILWLIGSTYLLSPHDPPRTA